MPTRTTPRTPPASRFGRTPPASRFGRTPSTPSGRFGRTPSTPSGRFGRSPSSRPSTRRSTPSSRLAVRRKPAPRSKGNKALNGLAGLIPGSVLGRAAKPSASSGGGKGRKAGFALLAGAAGLALKNREKLPGPLGRKQDAEPVAAPAPDPLAPSGPVPATPTSQTSAGNTPPPAL